MKKLFSFIIFALCILAFAASPAFSMEETGSAAQLAMHFADIRPDMRVARLRTFLESYNSPIAPDAGTFVAQADKYNLDWKLVAAIAGVESTFGKQIPYGSYNGWGWGVFTGTQDGVHFKDWADGIAQVSKGLRQNYLDRGAKTI